MRDWSLAPGDPLFLTLSADARLCAPDYVNDHIWELEFGTGDPASLSLYTTYGLRARSMRLFPRFIEADASVTDPKAFSKPPCLRRFYPNFLVVECSPFENLDVVVEYWAPESHAIAGRVSLTNRTTATRQIKFELCGALAPLEGHNLTMTQHQMVNVLAGQTSGLFPLIFMTGGPEHGRGPHASLLLDLELGPGATRRFTFAQAALDTIPASFELARHTAARNWDAERARIERFGDSQTIEIYTGDVEWDAALAFSQTAALGLIFNANDKLPNPTFVQARQPDHGFSRKGDGTDYPPAWSGQTPLESYYLAGLLPGAPKIAQGLLNNFLAAQNEDGAVDNKPGLAGQRGKFLAAPLLASLAWKIYESNRSEDFLAELYPRLLKFFWAWFAPDHDRDGDGVPEWDHILQTGFEENPLFDVWHPWSQGLDISLVHSPALHAMLYREAASLIRMAEILSKNEDLALLHAQADRLRSNVHESWNARTGLYCYRDHATNLMSEGKIIAKRKGAGNMRPKFESQAPVRLLIEIQTKSPAAKRPEVEINEFFNKKGEREVIAGHQFQWRTGGLVAASQKVFARVGRIAVSGLEEKDRVVVRTVDTSGEDLTLALPLWASIPERQQAQVIMGRSLTDAERFFRPYGLPALPLRPAPEADPVSMSVHLPWNALIGEGMLAYGFRKDAARLTARLMNGVIQSLKQSRSFHQRYHAEKGTGIGERNSLNGFAPVELFLETLGVKIYSRQRLRLEGSNPFPWPVTIKYRGLTVLRGLAETIITFPNGKSVTITDTASCIVSM
jgi:hypothetical protein